MIFKKTLFKKNILSLIALLISRTSYSRLAASSFLTTSQLIQAIRLGMAVTDNNITYYGASLALLSREGPKIFLLIREK